MGCDPYSNARLGNLPSSVNVWYWASVILGQCDILLFFFLMCYDWMLMSGSAIRMIDLYCMRICHGERSRIILLSHSPCEYASHSPSKRWTVRGHAFLRWKLRSASYVLYLRTKMGCDPYRNARLGNLPSSVNVWYLASVISFFCFFFDVVWLNVDERQCHTNNWSVLHENLSRRTTKDHFPLIFTV